MKEAGHTQKRVLYDSIYVECPEHNEGRSQHEESQQQYGNITHGRHVDKGTFPFNFGFSHNRNPLKSFVSSCKSLYDRKSYFIEAISQLINLIRIVIVSNYR